MYKKEVLLFVFLILSIFLINFISADDGCWITTRAICQESGHVIIGMSDESNAHGELDTESSYSTALCCTMAFALSSGESRQEKALELISWGFCVMLPGLVY